jgi:ABC-type branched-subunit amino acid transport system substrate-binding protein
MLLAVAVLAGCGGGEKKEIRPGALEIGVAATGLEPLVLEGVQVAAAAINAFGGVGGAAPIELVTGTVEQLLDRRVRLIVLPCRDAAARAGAELVQQRNAVAVAPCNDGTLPLLSRVFPTALSPAAQAAALAEQVRAPVDLMPPRTRRGRVVARLLSRRMPTGSGDPDAGTDAPETVRPPADAVEGVVYVTYGFPEPGNELDEFYERYKALFGRRPTSVVAALAADALDVLATAIEEAGSVEPLAVAHQIRYEGVEAGGVLGTIEFTGGTLRPRNEWVALRVEAGRYRVVDRS